MKVIRVYSEGDLSSLKLNKTLKEMDEDFGIKCFYESNMFGEDAIDRIAKKMARIRVKNPLKREFIEPLPGEIEYERRRIKGKYRSTGIMYDGFELLELLRDIHGKKTGEIFLFVTDRLIGTFDEGDFRYHLRYSVMGGVWNIISVNGFIYAPARPKEYYLAQRMVGDKADDLFTTELEKVFGDRIIKKGDERLSEVFKSAVFQILFYAERGEGFCDVLGCRLYNPHWQDELVVSMVKRRGELGLCEKHEKMFCELKNDKN